jgi:polyketide cyclase/dehydrase/lipid transport protein
MTDPMRLNTSGRTIANPIWWRCVVLLAITLASPCTEGQEVTVRASREGDAVVLEAQGHVKAEARLAWEVVTGYDHYAEFVPDLDSSRILMRLGDTAIVEQRGRLGFFLFQFPLQVRLMVTETPFERVSSYAISGNVKEMTGTYELVPEGTTLRFLYHGRIVPAFQLPSLIGVAAVRHAVEQQFTALVKEVQRREALARQVQQ